MDLQQTDTMSLPYDRRLVRKLIKRRAASSFVWSKSILDKYCVIQRCQLDNVLTARRVT